jgi:hypothetical protein
MKKDTRTSFLAPYSLSLGDCFEIWAQPFLKKRGFSSATLLLCWPAIVGSELATHTMPLRIVKDRLELKVSPAFHLDVQYLSGQIIERINTALGGSSLKEITLKKGVIEGVDHGQEAFPIRSQTLSLQDQTRAMRLVNRADLSEISCPKLEKALTALAEGAVRYEKNS